MLLHGTPPQEGDNQGSRPPSQMKATIRGANAQSTDGEPSHHHCGSNQQTRKDDVSHESTLLQTATTPPEVYGHQSQQLGRKGGFAVTYRRPTPSVVPPSSGQHGNRGDCSQRRKLIKKTTTNRLKRTPETDANFPANNVSHLIRCCFTCSGSHSWAQRALEAGTSHIPGTANRCSHPSHCPVTPGAGQLRPAHPYNR